MRARNIKPGFFKNEKLAELSPLARILFSGLWCCADREGRLEDRPKRLKAEILPYDDCDSDELLLKLHDDGFIQRYVVGEKKYIQIVNFLKHQNPHSKEAASSIPAPEKYSTSIVSKPEKHSSSPADSLIPDSLNPDTSSTPQKGDGEKKLSPTKLPDWIDKGTWDSFVAMREKIKKPMTDKAKELLIQKLEAFRARGHDIKAIMEQSIFHSWQDVYRLKGGEFNNNDNNNRSDTGKTDGQAQSDDEPYPVDGVYGLVP